MRRLMLTLLMAALMVVTIGASASPAFAAEDPPQHVCLPRSEKGPPNLMFLGPAWGDGATHPGAPAGVLHPGACH